MKADKAPDTFQRDPNSFAKKNASHLAGGVDIFSQLSTILRSDW